MLVLCKIYSHHFVIFLLLVLPNILLGHDSKERYDFLSVSGLMLQQMVRHDECSCNLYIHFAGRLDSSGLSVHT